MTKNEFVAYLNRYTTLSPDHEKAFDEFIIQSPLLVGEPLRLETGTEKFVSECFKREHPPSIVLTGNAGDGKTYLCRQIIEAFAKQPVTGWQHADWPISRNGLTLRVVKDLSEIDDAVSSAVLFDLQTSVDESPNTIFLIAANEGRLRALLANPRLARLHAVIDEQLTNGPDVENRHLIVLDLTRVTTSTYVPRCLGFLTNSERWNACQPCSAIDICPIKFNRERLADRHISSRLQLLYQLLEHLEIHVTIRDMLIHLAFTITGGLTCANVIEHMRKLDRAPQNYAYYENVWGTCADPSTRRKMVVADGLQHLDVGVRSRFEADDFVINGTTEKGNERGQHTPLFVPAIDLNGKQFSQERGDYLRGGAESPAPGTGHPFLDWLPHCRRKLYFEWQDVEGADRLIPFEFFPLFLQLVRGDREALFRVKQDIIRGLNRSFSGLFVTMGDWLYVTSQYAHAVEQPVPVIRLKRSIDNIRLGLREDTQNVFDHDQRLLQLKILHPRTGETGAIDWDINLLRFEYLMRLAQGGTPNVLAQECELSIRRLKDRLLTEFGSCSESDGQIEFFSAEHNRYVVKQLRVAEGKLRV